jgi:hypothetical protein
MFEAEPHAKAAIALRRWDDEAKVPKFGSPEEAVEYADAVCFFQARLGHIDEAGLSLRETRQHRY